MKCALTPKKMYEADKTAMEVCGVPSLVLMENAARSCVEHIRDFIARSGKTVRSVLVLCGSGNNGGDGFAIVRRLHENFDVRCAWIGDEEKMTPETRANFLAAKNLCDDFVHIENENQVAGYDFSADCVIDAMIGVGGSENLRGKVVPILQKANAVDAIKIAVDAPTGLNSETGAAHRDCFKADLTSTMFALKTGLILNEGLDVCGEIRVAHLGVPAEITEKIADTLILEKCDVAEKFPKRRKRSSKFDYGRALIIAGSEKFPGAAALAANASVRSGAGLTVLFTTSVHPALAPEVIPRLCGKTESGSIAKSNISSILEECEKSDSIAIGPGLSDDEETIELVRRLLKEIDEKKPICIDADALKALDNNTILRENIVLTPHSGEFSKISGIKRKDVEKDSLAYAKQWAKKLHCPILLKCVPVVITNGEKTYLNTTGNPGMASGGSGDVLTGIIAALLAQSVDAFDAAALAAYLHGAAGDLFVENYSPAALAATDLINNLKRVIPSIYE